MSRRRSYKQHKCALCDYEWTDSTPCHPEAEDRCIACGWAETHRMRQVTPGVFEVRWAWDPDMSFKGTWRECYDHIKVGIHW